MLGLPVLFLEKKSFYFPLHHLLTEELGPQLPCQSHILPRMAAWFIIKIILKSSHGTNRDNLIRGGLSKFLTCFLAEPGEMSPSKAAANVSSRKSLEPGPGVPGKFQVSSAPNLGLEPQAQNHPVSHHFSAGTKSPSLPSRPSVGLYVGVWGVNVSSVEPRRSLEEVHKA